MTGAAHHFGPRGLNRDRIVSTAVDIAREVGVYKVSLREIASRHDCVVMSFYKYIDSKDDLVWAMVERLCGPERAAELAYPPGADTFTADVIRARRYLAIATALLDSNQQHTAAPPVQQPGRGNGGMS